MVQDPQKEHLAVELQGVLCCFVEWGHSQSALESPVEASRVVCVHSFPGYATSPAPALALIWELRGWKMLQRGSSRETLPAVLCSALEPSI